MVRPSAVCTATARPSLHFDGIDGLSAFQLGAHRRAPRDQGPGESAGSAHRYRKAHVLGEHRHQKAHHAATRGVDGHVGVHGVAEQQQPGGVAVEYFWASTEAGSISSRASAELRRCPVVQQLSGCAAAGTGRTMSPERAP